MSQAHSALRSLACFGLMVAGALAVPVAAFGDVIIMDPTTNNGSFETPDLGDYGSAAIPSWNHPGGSSNFQIRQPGYLVGASNGTQSLHVVNLAGWYSNVLTNTPLAAGETVTMSVDTGWDSWVNAAASQGSTYYLYAVDPNDFNNQALMLSFSGIANYNGYGTDAGWHTDSGNALVQGAWDGWYTQVVVASGGTANNMVDNFVITMTGAVPEPSSALAACAVTGLALRRCRRRVA